LITENLLTLKIHKLTQAQYNRELEAGRIDESALYLTPDEEIDLSPYATKEELDTKSDKSHNHTIANVDNLQSSLDAKQATITGGATTITNSNLTANRALISNGSGKVAVSDVTSTELGYLDGVTSAIQTQLNGKAASSHTHNTSYIPDTRDNNQTPAWYITNYPNQVITEFKTTSAIGLTGAAYCKLTTYVQWGNNSGGYPSQETIIKGKIYTRYGTADSTWSAWKTNVDDSDVATIAEVKAYLGI
jgi:hypothetical protein